jgi:hypothetical protein
MHTEQGTPRAAHRLLRLGAQPSPMGYRVHQQKAWVQSKMKYFLHWPDANQKVTVSHEYYGLVLRNHRQKANNKHKSSTKITELVRGNESILQIEENK